MSSTNFNCDEVTNSNGLNITLAIAGDIYKNHIEDFLSRKSLGWPTNNNGSATSSPLPHHQTLASRHTMGSPTFSKTYHDRLP
jgi:hypothetical protein